MTFQELKKRCENRNFDEIIVVVKDIFSVIAEKRRILGFTPGDIRICTDKTDKNLADKDGIIKYAEKRAVFFYENTSICFVEPISGNTLYSRYLDKYGEGICCVRERISPDKFESERSRYISKGYSPAQTMENDNCKKAWFDITDKLGILFEIISDDSKKITPAHIINDKIQQINITTPDVQKTIEFITDLMEIGPWELGVQNKNTVHDHGFLNNGIFDPEVDFEFIVAILPCGNIEWEAIQPLKGPLVYYDFLKRHGIGYHHILQEVQCSKWQETFKHFESKGIDLACKGSVGPVDWCYMNTEPYLKYYTEMRTDAAMTKLPDGYFMKFYPEEN